MSKFLTDKAFFSCDLNRLPFFKVSANQNTVLLKGAPVLTKDSSLKVMGQKPCAQLAMQTQGVQQFCLKQFGPWLPTGMDNSHTVNGSPLLTDQASCQCMLFGCKIGFANIDMANPGIFTNGILSWTGADGGHNDSRQPGTGQKHGEGGQTQEARTQKTGGREAMPVKNQEKIDAPCKNSPANGQAKSSKEPVKESAKKYFYACHDCSHSDCALDMELKRAYGDIGVEEIDWDSLPLVVENKSSVLRSNYLKKLDEDTGTLADKAYMEAEKKLGAKHGSWKYQAHHLVSGKQVFAKMPELVRMAHVCGYDINHRRNCIMLISNEDDFGSLEQGMKRLDKNTDADDLKGEARAAQAYDAMKTARIQWHVGHHYYSFDEDEKRSIRAALPGNGNALAEVACYKDILEERLKRLGEFAARKPTPDKEGRVCPHDFIAAMNGLSASIRDKLASFYDNFRSSHPWYVSRQSYLFAFGLPLRFRLVTMHVQGEIFLLEKFKILRGLDGNAHVKEDGMPLLYDPGKDPMGACARFCSNIEHFLFFGNCGPQQLPFMPETDRPVDIYCRMAWHGNYGSKNYLEKNLSEMLAWIGGNMDYEYKTPMQRCRERMENARKLKSDISL